MKLWQLGIVHIIIASNGLFQVFCAFAISNKVFYYTFGRVSIISISLVAFLLAGIVRSVHALLLFVEIEVVERNALLLTDGGLYAVDGIENALVRMLP